MNLSLLHPFEDLRSLDLSESRFNGFVDEVEGTQSFFFLCGSLTISLLERSDLTFGIYKRKNKFLICRFIGLRRLYNSEILDLSLNTFKNNIFPFFNEASSLKTFFLQNTHETIPPIFFQFRLLFYK